MPEETVAKTYIGGQAVIEGVMMRAPGCLSVAVRRPDGAIVIQEGPLPSRFSHKPWKWPGFRGVAMLVESMSIGFRTLQFSAEQQMTDEEKSETAQSSSGKVAVVISTLFALGLFMALPQLLANGTGKLLGIDFALSDPRFHWVIGGFKLLIFLLYLFAISRLSDVQRVFQYHGAEHKTINAYEHGLALTVDNVRKQTTMHPRCGTTFIVVVVLVSILVGSAVAPLVLPDLTGFQGQLALLALRIGLLPFIAAISYELQRLSARYCQTGPLRVVLYPGFLFQKISTREPDDAQIEIAIAAMKTAAWRAEEEANTSSQSQPQSQSQSLLVFEGFSQFLDALPNLGDAYASVSASASVSVSAR